MSWSFMKISIETFKLLHHEGNGKITQEVFEARDNQFMLSKRFWAHKGKTHPSCDEIVDIFSLLL